VTGVANKEASEALGGREEAGGGGGWGDEVADLVGISGACRPIMIDRDGSCNERRRREVVDEVGWWER
jgi:hypothetical protein